MHSEHIDMMEPKWFWMAVTVLFIGGWCATEGCLEEERVALLQLKSFFDDPYDYLRDWEDVKGSNCCEWNRVKCSISTTRVIQLSLNDTRQWHSDRNTGYLNVSLFHPFKELKSLYLSDNMIAAFVENGDFGKVASALRKLEILDLSYNYLNDSILSSLSGLSSLKSLYLGRNLFRGSNHTNGYQWLSRLGNLETLDLSLNKLKNNFLLHVGGLSSLKTLNLAFNQLGGSVNITEFNKLAKLNKLYMNFNRIESLQAFHDSERQLKLKNLEELDLSYNRLNNSILGVVSGLSSLKNLNVRFNQLEGSINIKELEGLKDLEALDFSYNFVAPKDDSLLNDNILESIGAFTSLKSLTLSNSGLTGPLPAKGWCDLWNLEELDLSGNALEGEIPSCFHNLTSLRLLDISKNHIEIPFSLISFTNNSHLQLLFIDQNSLVREPTFQTHTKNPKFQLKLLSMSNCSTKGLIPKELPNFLYDQYDLRYLDFSFNKFGGENPYWLLENNTWLQHFLIAGNSFKGLLQLPKHANVDLAGVDMSGNKMQGQIPMNICSTFPRLVFLFLSQNAFEDKIPPCLGGLKSLRHLDLSSNNFSGGIQEELAKSKSLQTLRLSNNNLSGKIPPSILSSSTLEQLYLDGNNFDGGIPLIDISTAEFLLLDLVLSNNHLSGTLPRWIWNVSGLEVLDFSKNHFAGHIPLELCNLGRLRFLDLSQNNFTGSVPSCFSSLTIAHLYLSRNKLSGPLPRALYSSPSLVTVDLGHNDLTGNIPNWIRTLSALSVLILKANHFEGEIPSQICQLNSLTIVDLSQNKLFGPIPSCLSNLTLEPTSGKSFANGYIAYAINVPSNKVIISQFYPNSYVEEQVMFTTKKGLYTYSGKILDYMSGIDLSCNKLSGQIPPEIGNMSKLHSLNLSHNSLTGFIPSAFSMLKQIESLDLSHNKLSGIIPIQLMELNSLAVFNVSYNNLSGNIPYEKAQFATFDENSYLGNPFLCGPPKNESCTTETGSKPNASGSEEESGLFDKQVFYVTFWVCYAIVLMTIGIVLYINPHWRRTWFYFVQQCIDTGYYFILDNVIGFSLFRRRSS